MAELFKMPKLGMDMEEGTIVNWLKAEGDKVEKGEQLVEIETDKSTVSVEAPASGVILKLYYPNGETTPCGEVIAAIGAAGEAAPEVNAAKSAEKAEEKAAAPTAQPAVDFPGFFKMPKLGMDMEEGTVVHWLKAEGDKVEKGEQLVEIETDKSTVSVEAPMSGVILKIYLSEGESTPCGTPIAAIGAEGETAPELCAAQPVKAEEPKAEPVAAPAAVAVPTPAPVFAAPTASNANRTPGGRIRSTPRARRLAEKNGVDIALVAGTGPSGRIIEEDVRNFIASGAAASVSVARRIPQETVSPLTGIRKVTARRMKQSLEGSAQLNHRVDVDVTNLLNFRSQVNARLEKDGIKFSIADILTAACAKALIEHPMANCSLMADGIHYRNFANIGIAVDTPKGLVVPVVKDADVLSLAEISKSSRALIEKARNGALTPNDMSGGSFTISNLGMFEIDSFTAILNPPETCILAVGRIADRVVAENGQMVIRPMMNLCLTYDHQILDGAPAARFLQTVKHYIENPVWIMM